jgi:hypothetical protein
VGGGVLRRRGSSGGRRVWWKVPAASEGQGEDEGQSHLARKSLEEVLTEDGGQRRRRLWRSGGAIGLWGGPAAPREEDDGEGRLELQGVWVEAVLTEERRGEVFLSKYGKVAACRRPRADNRQKADVGGRFEGLLGGQAHLNWRRRCGGVFGGYCAEAERGNNIEGGSDLTRGEEGKRGRRGWHGLLSS